MASRGLPKASPMMISFECSGPSPSRVSLVGCDVRSSDIVESRTFASAFFPTFRFVQCKPAVLQDIY